MGPREREVATLESRPPVTVISGATWMLVSGAASGYFAMTENTIGLAAAMAAFFAPTIQAADKGVKLMRNLSPFGVKGVGHLEALGCNRIYANRYDSMPDIARSVIHQAQKRTGRLIIVGVADREFLHQDRYQIDGRTKLFVSLRDLLNDEHCHVDAVFAALDPDCAEAIRREGMEEGEQTRAEIRISIKNYRQFFDSQRVRLGLYEVRPFRFLVITDDTAYVQNYSIAPPRGWRGGCFGPMGKVERYRADSEGYEIALGEALSLQEELNWVSQHAHAAGTP